MPLYYFPLADIPSELVIVLMRLKRTPIPLFFFCFFSQDDAGTGSLWILTHLFIKLILKFFLCLFGFLDWNTAPILTYFYQPILIVLTGSLT